MFHLIVHFPFDNVQDSTSWNNCKMAIWTVSNQLTVYLLMALLTGPSQLRTLDTWLRSWNSTSWFSWPTCQKNSAKWRAKISLISLCLFYQDLLKKYPKFQDLITLQVLSYWSTILNFSIFLMLNIHDDFQNFPRWWTGALL